MGLGGITPFTTVDWPGRLACVAWLAGCPWRCPYCQNHALQSPASAAFDESELLALLESRAGLLDGVVFSGGEPLAQERVIEVARRVRDMGFSVALHTCGAFPDRLREMLPLLDWVGIDVKAPWDRYDDITHAPDSGVAARTSLQMVLDAGMPMEARTTWHPSLLTPDDLTAIALQLAELGVPAWRVQAYRSEGSTGQLPDETVYPHDVPAQAQAAIADYAFRRA